MTFSTSATETGSSALGFDADEIFEMIETWLPLFLTGKVEARYLTRPNRSLFSEFMGAAGNCSVRFSTLRGGSVRPRAFFSESGELLPAGAPMPAPEEEQDLPCTDEVLD